MIQVSNINLKISEDKCNSPKKEVLIWNPVVHRRLDHQGENNHEIKYTFFISKTKEVGLKFQEKFRNYYGRVEAENGLNFKESQAQHKNRLPYNK